MKLNKANLSGLTSPEQQSEMKSILAGSWPSLKPLPVFKYETAEYRATIDFDRKRGEWVCRKTSLPSNEVQELRGGLRAITAALPHGDAEMFTEGTEQQEQELEKDTNRRIQAIREWREKYANGARYFELRDSLSEGQRTELDDSLRQTLTARQLQFNSKNVANVFDDLSVAGGRFAALIEFATRSKASQSQSQSIAPQAQGEESVPEAEPATDDSKQSLGVSSRELEPDLNHFGPDPNDNDPVAPEQEAAGQRTDADDFPALSINDVFPEQELTSLPERMPHTASSQFEIEDSEFVDADSPSLVEPAQEQGRRSAAFAGFAAQLRTVPPSGERIEASPWRFPRLEISAFHVNVFALFFLFAATAFTVGLTVGRGPVGKRLREPPQSLLATYAKPPVPPDQSNQADESTPRTPLPPVESSDDSAGAKRPDDATPSEEKFEQPARSPEYSAVARSTDSDSSATTESEPPVKPEARSEPSGAIGPVARNVPPPASFKLAHPLKTVRRINRAPSSPAPYRLASAVGPPPRLPRPSTVLVNVPGRGSQPFRVSFPKKTIAATSSLAMTSELSVFVFPEPRTAVARKPARLEAGDLVSFVWPRYSNPGYRYGLAETIRVRATIGQLGQVLEVKFLGGSASLLPATMAAIRQWRYKPTLLNKSPVQAQQDVTIEFRPQQYSAQVSTRHPSHN